MVVAVLICLLLVNALGVVLVLFQLPGTWLMLVATGLAAWSLGDRSPFGVWLVVALAVLAVLGEVVETAAGAIGSRRAGGSRRGAVLSVLTAIAGATVGASLAGSLSLAILWLVPAWLAIVLAGAAVGAGVGSIVGDRLAGRTWRESGRSGLGAAVGRLGGTGGKLAIAAAMWLTVALAMVL